MTWPEAAVYIALIAGAVIVIVVFLMFAEIEWEWGPRKKRDE